MGPLAVIALNPPYTEPETMKECASGQLARGARRAAHGAHGALVASRRSPFARTLTARPARTPIEAGEDKLTVTVTARFELTQ